MWLLLNLKNQTNSHILELVLSFYRVTITFLWVPFHDIIVKFSRLLKFFISIGTICQTLEAKNFNEIRPYLLLLTEFLKKLLCFCKLYFNVLGKENAIHYLIKYIFFHFA